MQNPKTNDLNDTVETNRSPNGEPRAADRQTPPRIPASPTTSVAQSAHAERLRVALEETGLAQRFDHYVSEDFLYVFKGADTYEHVRRIDDFKDVLSMRLFAARYFPDHESYEIIGFDAYEITTSHSTPSFLVDIEVIADISFRSGIPDLTVLFEDADFPITLRLMPNESSVLFCQDCLDSKIGVVDAFFEPTIRFLKEVVLDPRSESIFWQI